MDILWLLKHIEKLWYIGKVVTEPVHILRILRRTVAVVRMLTKSELKLEKLKEAAKEAKTGKEL